MSIGVFACSEFGLFVLNYLRSNEIGVSVIVVDSGNFHGCNADILSAAGTFGCKTLYSADIYSNSNIEHLKSLELDFIILGWWPHIIKPPLLGVPRLGYINTHPSYLPYGRGKFSNFWAIVENTPYGATLQIIDEGIDTGKIIAQREIPITWEDTGKTLYEKAGALCRELFEENIQNILSGNYSLTEQDEAKATNHFSGEIDKVSRIILDKDYKARELINLLRARTFKPHPGAYFYDGGEKYELTVEIRKCKGSGTNSFVKQKFNE